jgi:hypothetical protein
MHDMVKPNLIFVKVSWHARTPIFVSVISLWSYTIIAGNELTAATAFTALLVFDELRVALNVLPHFMSDAMQVLVRYVYIFQRS